MLTEDLLELYAEQWLGAVAAARAHGCDFICFCGRSLADTGPQRQSNAIYDLVTAETLDGLIVWTSTLGINVGRERMERFRRRFEGLPLVSMEQPLGDAPVVLMENRQGMDAAVSHLIEVHGRQRIAFVRGPATHDGAQQRYLGYLDALARHGLVAHPELVSAYPASWGPEISAALVTRMLAEHEPPDAIAAANDGVAVGALSALAAAGLRTPDDVAVVGFDNQVNVRNDDLGLDSGSDDETPVRRTINIDVGTLSLTTVRGPFHDLGRRAVEAVLCMIRGDAVPAAVSVPTELVVRRSCGCLPIASSPTLAPSAPTEQAISRLPHLLTHRSAGLPADWPERLSAAFVRDLGGESRGVFLGLLDELVQVSLRSGESVENWWRVLFTLRQIIGHPASGAAEITRAEDVWLHAQMLLNEAAERHWRYVRVLADKRNQIVREVGQRLITARDVAGLAETLAEELPKVGVPGCYVASYESVAPGADKTTGVPSITPTGEVSTAWSRLLLAYENGAPTAVDPDSAVFASAHLVPGDRLRRDAPYSMVAAPLYLNDQLLGFALFELGPRIGWIYAALREQVSSALHRVFMVERERAALAALEEAHRRAERHRLAGELHDSVSQALFSMTLHTRAAQLAAQHEGVDPRGRVARGLVELRELTQGALTEMRALIFHLRPTALHEDGLVAAVRKHAAAVAAREGFEVCVHAPPDRLPLDERAEDELFRVVQEALHNSVKHARPGRVEIRFRAHPDAPATLVVEVADDGVGFDPDARHPGHLGLSTMHERTRRLGGRFTVDSSPAGSTTVRAVLPEILRRPTADTPTTGTAPT